MSTSILPGSIAREKEVKKVFHTALQGRGGKGNFLTMRYKGGAEKEKALETEATSKRGAIQYLHLQGWSIRTGLA